MRSVRLTQGEPQFLLFLAVHRTRCGWPRKTAHLSCEVVLHTNAIFALYHAPLPPLVSLDEGLTFLDLLVKRVEQSRNCRGVSLTRCARFDARTCLSEAERRNCLNGIGRVKASANKYGRARTTSKRAMQKQRQLGLGEGHVDNALASSGFAFDKRVDASVERIQPRVDVE
eukprot:scaffold201740_cov31-Tisochrysis_lutea.AAC.5